jgi:hypothetical protein
MLIVIFGVLIFLLVMTSFEDNILGLVFFGTPAFIILVYCALGLKQDIITQIFDYDTQLKRSVKYPLNITPASMYGIPIEEIKHYAEQRMNAHTTDTIRLNANIEDKIIAAVITTMNQQNEILRAEITRDILEVVGYDKIHRN